MKSTGLFGRNSGKVGGVVYSNYRGQQIVKAYQPQVKNPNTPRQITQRAKFKLLSQISSELANEVAVFGAKGNATPRNSWMSAMYPIVQYDNVGNQAILPISQIFLTNGHVGSLKISGNSVTLEGFNDTVILHEVVLAYPNSGNNITIVSTKDYVPTDNTVELDAVVLPAGLSSGRRLLYAYEYGNDENVVSYQNYIIATEAVKLNAILSRFGSELRYSETINIPVPQNV